MNAAGIPVLYMALEPETTIAEVRPAIGAWVIIGSFRPERELRLLDLTNLKVGVGSYFRADLDAAVGLRDFVSNFSRIISRPIAARNESLEYLSTQFVAEYLGHKIKPSFDGIIFQSSLTSKGKNVVLFEPAISIGIDDHRFPLSEDNISYVQIPPDEQPEFRLDTKRIKLNRKNYKDCKLKIIFSETKVQEVYGIDYQCIETDINNVNEE